MNALIVLEYIADVAFVWFMITQIIIPFAKEERWFPIFRNRKKVAEQLEVAKEELHDAQVAQEIAKTHFETTRVEKKTSKLEKI